MTEPRPLSVLIAQNAALTSLRFLAGLVSALLTSILVARHLGPGDFGTYRLTLSLIWVVEFLSVLAFPNATVKFVAELSGRPAASAPGAVLRFFLLRATTLYVVWLVGLLAVRHLVARFYRDEALASLLVVAAIAVLPGLWCGLLGAVLQGLQRFDALGTVGLVQALATLLGTVAVVALAGGVVDLLIVSMAVNVLGLVLAAAYARRHLRASPAAATLAADMRARMWRYSLLVGATALTSALLSERLEVFFLGRFWNAAEVGFYSLSMTLAYHARRLVPGALSEVLFPVIVRLEGAGDAWGVGNAYAHATRYLAMVGFPLSLGGALYAEPLLRLLFGPAYGPAAAPLAVLFLVTGVVSLAHPASAVILSKERYRFLLAASLLVAVANVLLDLLLIPPGAAVGAALANAIVQTAWVVLQMAAVARWLAQPLPLGNLARVFAAAVGAWLPAAALRTWPLLGGAIDLGLGVAGFLVLYPLLLAGSGALLGEDFARLRAVSQMLPAPGRVLAGGLLRTLDTCRSYRRSSADSARAACSGGGSEEAVKAPSEDVRAEDRG